MKLSSSQISEWLAYNRLEPFGQRHQDWHFGMLASMIANLFLKEGATPHRPEEFYRGSRLDFENRKQREKIGKMSGSSIKEFFKLFKRVKN